MRTKIALLVAAVVAVFALSACSSSGGGTASPTSAPTGSTTPAGSAKIDSFVVPDSVSCAAGATSASIAIRYATTGAAQVTLTLDGLGEPALSGPSGSVRERVHCDALDHTAVLTAIDAQGARTTLARNFTTKVSA